MTEYSSKSDQKETKSLRENRNFVKLLIGRLVTNAGDSLYTIAGTWLVYDLTGSSFYTGIAGALLLLPPALQFISGPLVDRWSITRTLTLTQLMQAILILFIPLAAYTDSLTVGIVLLLIPVLSLLNQFVYPAQNAALPRIVVKDELTQANSAFSFANKGTDMIFRALGGVLIAAVGAASLFVLNSVTFVIAALFFIGVNVPSADNSSEELGSINPSEYFSDLREGIACLRGTVFAEMMSITALTNLAVGVTIAVLPAFAAIRGGPALYGALLGAVGGGTLIGALISSRLEHIGYGRIRIFGFGLGFLLWIGAVYSSEPLLSIALFTLAWIPPGVTNVMGQTLMQTVTPEELLGRVTSVDSSVSTMTLPVGSLLGGAVSSILGVITTMGIAALGFGVASLYFALRPPLRRLPPMNDINVTDFNVGTRQTSAEEPN